MSQRQSEALTLRTYPYAEAHMIAVFLTRDAGKLRSVAYGAKRARRNPYGSSLEPLTYSRLTYSQKESDELAVVRDIEIIKAFPAFEQEWPVKLHFSYFAELLQEFTREGQEAEEVFRLSLAVLDAVPTTSILQLARYFEFWLLRLEGILPDLATRLPAELVEKTRYLMSRHPSRLGPGELTEGELKRLGRLSEELIESHLEKKLKSTRMLKELL